MDYDIHISKKEHLERYQLLQETIIEIYKTKDTDLSNELDKFYDCFMRIYIIHGKDKTDVYRHPYSIVLRTLIKLKAAGADPESLNQLSEKIRSCLAFSHQKYHQDKTEASNRLRNCLYKLWDHVTLDVIRINQMEMLHSDYNDLIFGFTDKIQNCRTDIDGLNTNIEKSKLDVVAILGIFAAIIIGFVAPIVFSSQLMANLKDTPAGKIMIASSVCGFVAISLFYMVYLILENIVFKNRERQPLREHLCNIKQWSLRDWILPVMVFVFGLIFVIGWCKLPENDAASVPDREHSDHSIVVNQNFK